MWVVDAAEGLTWRELRYHGQPAWLAVRLRLAPTADGVAVTGVQVERRDGRALTARDLRLVKLPPNWVLFAESAARWFPPAEGAATVAASKKGAHGKGDEHWRSVWLAWCQAMEAAPHAPVKYLLATGRWQVADATMRRWIARARGGPPSSDGTRKHRYRRKVMDFCGKTNSDQQRSRQQEAATRP